MKPDDAFSALIGRIYDCALDTTLWSQVLGEITEAVGGCMADLSVINPLKGEVQVMAFYNWPTDLLERARAHIRINPVAPIGLTAPLCEPLCSSRDLDIEAFHNSLYWRKCFADGGYYDYITAVIARTATSFGYWGVVGDNARGPYNDDDLHFARVISPHIRRSVEISGLLQHQRLIAGTLSGVLNSLAGAALVVSKDGRIRFLNPRAQEEIARGTLLTQSRDRLIGVTPEALQLVATVTASTGRRSTRGQDSLLQEAGGRVLHASWVELEQAGQELDGSTLLLLREPEADLTTPLGTAAAFYHLTRSETQVLAQVLNGQTLPEVAEILGVARSTVKSHLDAIYYKTNTHGQTELVHLIMGLASPLRPHTKA